MSLLLPVRVLPQVPPFVLVGSCFPAEGCQARLSCFGLVACIQLGLSGVVLVSLLPCQTVTVQAVTVGCCHGPHTLVLVVGCSQALAYPRH